MTAKEPKEQRVDDVIRAAVAEFVEKGFEGASVESIAKRAKLTKGGLYHHFKSKDEILLAANDQFMDPIRRMAEKAEAAASPAAGLGAFFLAYLEHWRERPRELAVVALTLAKAVQDSSWWPMMATYSREMTGFYRRLLEKAAAAGEIAAGDAEAQATAILGAVDGLAAYVLMDDTLTPEEAAARLSRAFLCPRTAPRKKAG
ncbi:MAG: TetR/AcrR family transcriptional regulator [Thermotogota bacterium]